jgi:hypothetical protein
VAAFHRQLRAPLSLLHVATKACVGSCMPVTRSSRRLGLSARVYRHQPRLSKVCACLGKDICLAYFLASVNVSLRCVDRGAARARERESRGCRRVQGVARIARDGMQRRASLTDVGASLKPFLQAMRLHQPPSSLHKGLRRRLDDATEMPCHIPTRRVSVKAK